ncbi:MAG: glycosyltransferase [Gammaproteobacteria bacterium]|nr:glycosyltransferase [Gammaproteobacteria bacterium]
MHVAFAIFKFFPHGGSARDLVKIVSRCRERGHDVRIYALEWQGAPLKGAETIVLAAAGVRSHVRQRRFAGLVADHVARHPVDLVVGMNKMPGLDVYYAADSCFEQKARTQRPWSYRLTARYRHYAEFERAAFAEHGRTRILTIAPDQDAAFKAIYRTPAHRFHPLPPGIERDRGSATAQAGRALRSELGVAAADILLLFVGSGFVKKGLDRAIAGVGALPLEVRARVRLVVVGDDRAARFKRLAQRLGVASQVQFVGGRDDLAACYRAADALVLPAYDEAGGMVILEAASAGVPVLATANCGYASYLEEANAGIVTPEPFEQARFDADLLRLLTADERDAWRRGGRRLARDDCLSAMAPRAVELLETFAAGCEPPMVSFSALDYSRADPKYRSLFPVAHACQQRGMKVRVFVGRWRDFSPAGIDIVAVPVTALGRAARRRRRRDWVAECLRLTPAGCFVDVDAASGIGIEAGTADDPKADPRLPLGLERSRNRAGIRNALREEHGFTARTVVFAMAGGDLVEHGIERMLMALGRLPEALRDRCAVLATGRLDRGFGAAGRVLKLDGRIVVLDELPALDAIAASDAFVDLPYRASANGWVFDAIAAGRPVITHAGLEESTLVQAADAGLVLAVPFRQRDFNLAVADFAGSVEARGTWSANATRFARDPANYGHADRVAVAIERQAQMGSARA